VTYKRIGLVSKFERLNSVSAGEANVSVSAGEGLCLVLGFNVSCPSLSEEDSVGRY